MRTAATAFAAASTTQKIDGCRVFSPAALAQMAELVDAPDSKSGSDEECGFESHSGHQK